MEVLTPTVLAEIRKEAVIVAEYEERHPSKGGPVCIGRVMLACMRVALVVGREQSTPKP